MKLLFWAVVLFLVLFLRRHWYTLCHQILPVLQVTIAPKNHCVFTFDCLCSVHLQIVDTSPRLNKFSCSVFRVFVRFHVFRSLNILLTDRVFQHSLDLFRRTRTKCHLLLFVLLVNLCQLFYCFFLIQKWLFDPRCSYVSFPPCREGLRLLKFLHSFVYFVNPPLSGIFVRYAEDKASLAIEKVALLWSPGACLSEHSVLLVCNCLTKLLFKNWSIFNEVLERFALRFIAHSNRMTLDNSVCLIDS